MVLSQVEFEALLQCLREQQTESPIVDGKADLPLETEGDRAFFIRHVAALANNVEPSHLIIGVEDKTWDPIGLSKASPLRDSDRTQRRMNQILANRLDPNVSVRYRAYEVSGVVLGLVVVEGTRAPYIIAIEDQQYGGARTRGEPSYVYRGAIYVRHGANSVIANRQSEILEIVKAQQAVAPNDQPDEFLTTHKYFDINSEDFGHHPLSIRLVEVHLKKGMSAPPDIEYVLARSWVSFVFFPVDSGCQIDTVALGAKLKPDQRIGRGPEWYHGVPEEFLDMFWSPQAVPREFLGTWQPRQSANTEGITHFICIQPSGHIEVGCTYPLFYQCDGARFFSFVTLIGYLWQMVYLSRAIYCDVSFCGEATVLVNLIGTNETRLADFARSQRGGWASPFSPEYLTSTSPERETCYYPNIQIERRFPLADASDDEIETMIREIARDLGAYYGQDCPRCFDYHTDEFPYREYTQRVWS